MNIYSFLKKIHTHRNLLIFIGIAAVLWFFNKLNHRYVSQIPIEIEIVSDFNADMWIDNTKMTILANCEGDGRQLIMYKLGLGDKITIPASELVFQPVQNKPYHYTIDSQSFAKALAQKFSNIKVNFIIETFSNIYMSPLETRKMAVLSQIEVDCKKQYMLSAPVSMSPDSVIVRAPKAMLDTMKGVKTQTIIHEDVTFSLDGFVKLIAPKHTLLKVDEVQYNAPVTAFTEMSFNLPITVRNIPDHIDATVVPNKTNIKVKVPLNVYNNELKPVASIDFNYRSTSSLYRVAIDSLPSGAKLISIEPQFVKPLFEHIVKAK